MSSCPVATTRLGLILHMEHFSCPSQPLGPLQSKKVKHWGTGVQHQSLTVLLGFTGKCTSIVSVFVTPWGNNCCYLFFTCCYLFGFAWVKTLNPADLLWQVLLINLCKTDGHLCGEYWQFDLSFQTLLISRPYYHPQ